MEFYGFEVVILEVGIRVHNWIFMKWNTSSHKTHSNVITHVIYVAELSVIYLETFRGPDCHEHGPAKKASLFYFWPKRVLLKPIVSLTNFGAGSAYEIAVYK